MRLTTPRGLAPALLGRDQWHDELEGDELAAVEGQFHYEHFVPHTLIYATYFAATGFVVLMLLISGARYWKLLGANQERKGSLIGALIPALIDIGCQASNGIDVATLVVSNALPNNNVDCSSANIINGQVDTFAELRIGTSDIDDALLSVKHQPLANLLDKTGNQGFKHSPDAAGPEFAPRGQGCPSSSHRSQLCKSCRDGTRNKAG